MVNLGPKLLLKRPYRPGRPRTEVLAHVPADALDALDAQPGDELIVCPPGQDDHWRFRVEGCPDGDRYLLDTKWCEQELPL
jgi:hypothetical protein